MMACQVFISHAVADKDIAAELNRLLASGLNVTGRNVFCSSLPGRDIPGGFNFVAKIKDSLAEAKVVILLITENYLDSKFCLAEIGASWISKDNAVPVVVSPVGYDKLKATLALTQAWKIDDEDGLNSMADDICKALGTSVDHAQWGVEKKGFLKTVKKLIRAQVPPVKVDPEEHQELKNELEYCQNKIEELERKLSDKDTLIEELKGLKDADEVAEVEKSHLSELERFKDICDNAKKAVLQLPSIVGEALYYNTKGDSLPEPDDFDNYRWNEVHGAVDSCLLCHEPESPIELNTDHPRVRKATQPVSQLGEFMEKYEKILAPLIEDEHEVTFDMADKDFWDEFIG